jgi:hypothetical protein
MKIQAPKLTPLQKAQILGDDLTMHLADAAAKGGHVLPLTALSRRTDVLLGYLKKANHKQTPAKGRPVLTFVI